jgi:hypothetical protein
MSLQAPTEAEAQCAELVKGNKVYATATEDMDALTFGSTILLRHMTFSEARKMPIQEFYLDKVLAGLEMTMDEVPCSPCAHPCSSRLGLLLAVVYRPLHPPWLRLLRFHQR